MSDSVLVRVEGQVEQPLELSQADFSAFAEEEQVRDVSQIDARRKGDGVTLESVLQRVRPRSSATHLTMSSSLDGFSASVPLDAVRERGVLVYQIENRALKAEEGGPIRFIISNSAACRTDDLDDCANVKNVDRVELSEGKGPDTRA
ncbi:MAG: molybdopterin-dependent oxidoreductase [Planctomycetaceae bacterium]|jgi:DMSO/TMAO reductase YedYZ molybdopterin-dependent catalytic subunit|nr:molybdopterin-dependent oxidoreductase [Planctomycetaceae bacterium]MBT6484525.1 molybdopterin-dependent oxidoreductase [Planctomycetaceae bacterium]MBT6492978.1 molybdopterin-dependent oxidoreductase [Planctomycetaceae bacterium]